MSRNNSRINHTIMGIKDSFDEMDTVDKVATAALAVGLIGVAGATITGAVVSSSLVAGALVTWKGAAALASAVSSITSAAWKSALVAGTGLGGLILHNKKKKEIDDEYEYGGRKYV